MRKTAEHEDRQQQRVKAETLKHVRSARVWLHAGTGLVASRDLPQSARPKDKHTRVDCLRWNKKNSMAILPVCLWVWVYKRLRELFMTALKYGRNSVETGAGRGSTR